MPTAWIERLFERFGLVYGTEKMQALWRGQSLATVKAYWSEELAAYTASELRAGLDALRVKHPSWPPTLFEFMALCRPASAAIDPESAFSEAARGIEQRKRGKMGLWSHKAIYWAMVDVGQFDVQGSSWPQVKNRWTRALELRLTDENLPAIPEPPKQLAAPVREAGSGNADVDALAANLTLLPPFKMRGWIDKILEREARGDKTLSYLALKAARAAAAETPMVSK